MLRAVLVSAMAGITIPVVFLVSLRLSLGSTGAPGPLWYWLNRVALYLWPSSIFLLAESPRLGNFWRLLFLSVIVNVALYVMIGSLVGWGLRGHKWALYMAGLLVGALWWRLSHF